MVAGGDNGTGAGSKSKAAGERGDDDRDPAASFIEDQRRKVEDPGDRETPLDRDYGDPFEPNLSDILRAARLEGRKISTRTTVGATVGECFYRVDRFRRFLEKRGASGRGLIEFWGIRASRSYVVDNGASEWVKDPARKLHTLEVGSISKIK